jgi:sigma-B regulation protein RsbU (phosphoserine phosphatase)
LLPSKPPDIPGWELCAAWLPARETSGDFYDFFKLPGERYGILIADVVDKGMGAALLMALGRTLIRAHISDSPESPEKLLQTANARLRSELENGTMITMIYGILDPADSTFHYCNAGHPPAKLFQKNRKEELTLLGSTGMPLGMFDDASWGSQKIVLPDEALLLFYTDGIEDAQDESGGLFGPERIMQAIQTAVPKNGDEAKEALLKELAAFSGSTPRFDDVTFVVLSRNAQE